LKIDRKNTENLAFSMLLRDQLNTQLKLLEKQEAFIADIKKQNDEHNTQINQLKLQIDNVNQQLILLKRIDQTINERG
jgi:septal ring factor EnvC (AmiA/AmiB activator)